MESDHSGILLGPGEGKRIVLRSRERATLVKASGPDTGGAYGLQESSIPPATPGAPPHIHHDAEEAFYVLEGELTFQIDAQTIQAGAGSFLLVPRGAVHAFDNPGSRAARYLVIFSPAEAGRYFEELSELEQAAPDGRPDPSAIAALRRKYRWTYLET